MHRQVLNNRRPRCQQSLRSCLGESDANPHHRQVGVKRNATRLSLQLKAGRVKAEDITTIMMLHLLALSYDFGDALPSSKTKDTMTISGYGDASGETSKNHHRSAAGVVSPKARQVLSGTTLRSLKQRETVRQDVTRGKKVPRQCTAFHTESCNDLTILHRFSHRSCNVGMVSSV